MPFKVTLLVTRWFYVPHTLTSSERREVWHWFPEMQDTPQ